jgi:hypothetical protein
VAQLRHNPNFKLQIRMSGPPDSNLLEDLGFVNHWRFVRKTERHTRPSGFVGRLTAYRATCLAPRVGLREPSTGSP